MGLLKFFFFLIFVSISIFFYYEAWTFFYPHHSKMISTSQLRIISLATTGAVVGPLLGVAALAAVPWAMSTFGTVVAGVGTLHAPLISGGCAAILQSSSAALLSTKAVAIGAAVGTALGAICEQVNRPRTFYMEKKK
ncbi:hypothetical protein HMI55_005341 [Coelomomyces lativittatus]|nr:hypothetical protein HMI55_005341 [Coelomomyces lativittatus]KAJ1506160.1 hypothetical protein HMI56_000734 [Coelomomyces lativittatus]